MKKIIATIIGVSMLVPMFAFAQTTQSQQAIMTNLLQQLLALYETELAQLEAQLAQLQANQSAMQAEINSNSATTTTSSTTKSLSLGTIGTAASTTTVTPTTTPTSTLTQIQQLTPQVVTSTPIVVQNNTQTTPSIPVYIPTIKDYLSSCVATLDANSEYWPSPTSTPIITYVNGKIVSDDFNYYVVKNLISVTSTISTDTTTNLPLITFTPSMDSFAKSTVIPMLENDMANSDNSQKNIYAKQLQNVESTTYPIVCKREAGVSGGSWDAEIQ